MARGFARLAQDALRQDVDQAHFLGNGNEALDRDLAMLGIDPARRHFEAGDLMGAKIDAGLIARLDAILLDRGAQRGLHRGAFLDAHVHIRLEEA